ncbi:MAG: ABC transporter substrate-binding protein [Chlamydiae bacterium]|nr:ABC transporter substrate-binding protein [Chlamydiota bacterium]MBI3267361.1 ABC transporter substrate-binding protein [Chlamydiota bacterium]
MRKFLLVLAVGMGLVMGCGKKSDDVKIGVYASLTGNTATFGESMRKGIELAFEEINAQGGLLGKKVRLIVEDDQSKPEEAKTAVVKLIKRDRVVAVLGEVASSRSLAGAPECQRSSVPMVTPASTNPKVTEIGDYIFRVCFIDPFQGEVMAKFAYQTLGLRRVAVFTDVKNDYSVGLANYFEKTFLELGGKIIGEESYSEGDIEFRAQLTTIKSQKPEAIFIPGYYTEVGLIARQARELGFQGPLLGGDGWDSPKTVEIGGSAVEGCFFSNHYASDDPASVVQDFIRSFKEKYGEVPDAMAVLGYDAARVLADAIHRASSFQGAKIREALAQTKGYEGVSGRVTIDQNRNARKAAVVLKIENGRVKFFKRVEP